MEIRAQFTEVLQKWKASGQNDPDNFRNFLTYGANGQLNTIGKRLMVLFTCTRQGTDHADENFTNMCTKVIPQGGGYDEGGSGQWNGDGFATGKKRKRRDAESGESMKTSFKQLVNAVTDSHRMRAESQRIMAERRVEEREEAGSSKELRDLEEQGKPLQLFCFANDTYAHAAGGAEDGLKATGNAMLKDATKDFMKLLSSTLLSRSQKKLQSDEMVGRNGVEAAVGRATDSDIVGLTPIDDVVLINDVETVQTDAVLSHNG